MAARTCAASMPGYTYNLWRISRATHLAEGASFDDGEMGAILQS